VITAAAAVGIATFLMATLGTLLHLPGRMSAE
jgi:hypothetical protein